VSRKDRRRAEAQQRAQKSPLDWLKAAEVVATVIEEASPRGMQVILRPTTTPSPHGVTGPIEIVTSDDGRSVVITLFAVPEDLRKEFVAKLGKTGIAQVIREEKAE
jgi:hypothetical protein